MTKSEYPQASACPDPHLQTVVGHLGELRRRLIYSVLSLTGGVCGVYPFSGNIFEFLVRPLAILIGGPHRRLIYTGLSEAFVTYMKIALWGGVIVASPMIMAQVWLFIAPGLYRHEKSSFFWGLIASPVLFLAGAGMAYGVICPLAWKFFLSFETLSPAVGGLPIQLEARVSEYLALTLKLMWAFGLSFQLPLILLLLARTKCVKRETLARNRKYVFLGIVVGAAILTPPDLLSPLGLIVPSYGLFELSLMLMASQEKRRPS